jgi:CRP-like cAMP-binding protein
MPFDFIFREGCVGDELFFMRTGSVAILSGPGAYAVPLTTTKPGDHFGEVAVILGTFRRSWAMARTYVITSVLHKDVIDDLQVNYPEAFVQLVKEVKNSAGVHPKVSISQLADLLAEKFLDTADAFASMIADTSEATMEATATDFIKAMLDLGLSRFDALLLWSELDEDSSGSIDYDEFCTMCEKSKHSTKLEISKAKGRGGKIDRKKDGAKSGAELFSSRLIFSADQEADGTASNGHEPAEEEEEEEEDENNSSNSGKSGEKERLKIDVPGEEKDGSSPESSPRHRRSLPKIPASQLDDALQRWRSAKIHQKKAENSERPLCRETVREETLKIADDCAERFGEDILSLKGQLRNLHKVMDGILSQSGQQLKMKEKVKTASGPNNASSMKVKGMPIFLSCT